MLGMLDEGSFEQKNAVYNDALEHADGLKAAVIEADKSLKKSPGRRGRQDGQ